MHRRVWDGRARAEAELLGAAWPGWVVLYGTGSRHFHAFAAWPASEPLMLHDLTPEGLEERIREAETIHATAALFLTDSTDLFPAPLDRQRRIVAPVPTPREPIAL
ncbi:hypothetical protein [Streptosporangium sp. NPDC051022]|uniref:hypothetical protein n=1 Tax=Streptosporangium sp. NPDC051022 TaxID=3155752 RepID=UPI00341E8BDA